MEKYDIHIFGDRDFTISEFSKIIEAVNQSFNSIQKEKHVPTRDFNKKSPIISSVKSGSIILEIIIQLSIQIVANVVGGILLDKLKEKLNKKTVKTSINEETKIIEIEVNANEKNDM